MGLKGFYRRNYKKLMLIPSIILILSLVLVANKYNKSNELFERDVSLKGGISASVYSDKDVDVLELEEKLSKELKTEVSVRSLSDIATKKQIGVIIEVSDVNVRGNLKEVLEGNLNVELDKENYSVEEVGSSLGESFYKDMLKAVIIAFILMGIVVFIAFRSTIPSLAVILSAFLDIIGTIAVINIIGLKVSSAGIAALLLVIGYSVDSDILLTTRVLKRREGGLIIERIFDSAKTGLTMSATTFVALSIGYFVTNSMILKEMFLIIVIALVIDVIATYCMNSGILMMYKKGEINED